MIFLFSDFFEIIYVLILFKNSSSNILTENLNNLSKDISYQKIKDSLLEVINKRIVEANSYPESLGRQSENAAPIN